MPKIAKWKAFIFFIWTYDLREKPHLHIRKNRSNSGIAKIWIDNQAVAERGSFSDKEISECQKIIEQNKDYFLKQLEKHRNGIKIKFKVLA